MAVLTGASDAVVSGSVPPTGCSTTEVVDAKSDSLSGETATPADAPNSEERQAPRNFWFTASQNIVAWLRCSPSANQRADGCFDLLSTAIPPAGSPIQSDDNLGEFRKGESSVRPPKVLLSNIRSVHAPPAFAWFPREGAESEPAQNQNGQNVNTEVNSAYDVTVGINATAEKRCCIILAADNKILAIPLEGENDRDNTSSVGTSTPQPIFDLSPHLEMTGPYDLTHRVFREKQIVWTKNEKKKGRLGGKKSRNQNQTASLFISRKILNIAGEGSGDCGHHDPRVYPAREGLGESAVVVSEATEDADGECCVYVSFITEEICEVVAANEGAIKSNSVSRGSPSSSGLKNNNAALIGRSVCQRIHVVQVGWTSSQTSAKARTRSQEGQPSASSSSSPSASSSSGSESDSSYESAENDAEPFLKISAHQVFSRSLAPGEIVDSIDLISTQIRRRQRTAKPESESFFGTDAGNTNTAAGQVRQSNQNAVTVSNATNDSSFLSEDGDSVNNDDQKASSNRSSRRDLGGLRSNLSVRSLSSNVSVASLSSTSLSPVKRTNSKNNNLMEGTHRMSPAGSASGKKHDKKAENRQHFQHWAAREHLKSRDGLRSRGGSRTPSSCMSDVKEDINIVKGMPMEGEAALCSEFGFAGQTRGDGGVIYGGGGDSGVIYGEHISDESNGRSNNNRSSVNVTSQRQRLNTHYLAKLRDRSHSVEGSHNRPDPEESPTLEFTSSTPTRVKNVTASNRMIKSSSKNSTASLGSTLGRTSSTSSLVQRMQEKRLKEEAKLNLKVTQGTFFAAPANMTQNATNTTAANRLSPLKASSAKKATSKRAVSKKEDVYVKEDLLFADSVSDVSDVGSVKDNDNDDASSVRSVLSAALLAGGSAGTSDVQSDTTPRSTPRNGIKLAPLEGRTDVTPAENCKSGSRKTSNQSDPSSAVQSGTSGAVETGSFFETASLASTKKQKLPALSNTIRDSTPLKASLNTTVNATPSKGESKPTKRTKNLFDWRMVLCIRQGKGGRNGKKGKKPETNQEKKGKLAKGEQANLIEGTGRLAFLEFCEEAGGLISDVWNLMPTPMDCAHGVKPWAKFIDDSRLIVRKLMEWNP